MTDTTNFAVSVIVHLGQDMFNISNFITILFILALIMEYDTLLTQTTHII